MPSWLDLKVVLTLCSLLVACGAFLWNWQRTRKRLSHDYWSAPLMGSEKHNFSERLALTFDGQVVHNVSQVSVRIKNTGSISIERKDIDTALCVTFEQPSTVLSVSIIKKVPGDLEIDVLDRSDVQKSITLSPALLNPKDEFTIAALVSDFKTLELRGRIVGVNSFPRIKDGGVLKAAREVPTVIGLAAATASVIPLLTDLLPRFAHYLWETLKL